MCQYFLLFSHILFVAGAWLLKNIIVIVYKIRGLCCVNFFKIQPFNLTVNLFLLTFDFIIKLIFCNLSAYFKHISSHIFKTIKCLIASIHSLQKLQCALKFYFGQLFIERSHSEDHRKTPPQQIHEPNLVCIRLSYNDQAQQTFVLMKTS